MPLCLFIPRSLLKITNDFRLSRFMQIDVLDLEFDDRFRQRCRGESRRAEQGQRFVFKVVVFQQGFDDSRSFVVVNGAFQDGKARIDNGRIYGLRQ